MHELQSIIPKEDFNQRVIAFGSSSYNIESTNYKYDKLTIPIYPLSEIGKWTEGRNVSLIHTAFLTKDRIEKYGMKDFIQVNKEITNIVVESLRTCKSSRVVHISSGAAKAEEGEHRVSKNLGHNQYGVLKLEEEKKLMSSTMTQSFRLYALTGKFIREPRKYAIGDLLVRAIANKPLEIKAKYPV